MSAALQYVEWPASTVGIAGPLAESPLQGLSAPTQYTPPIDGDYIPRQEYLQELLGFWYSGEIAFKLVGHSGCGKTTLLEQWHACLNLPLLVVVAHPRMEISDLIGHYVPTEAGGLKFHYGPVALAAKNGWSVLIDEYNVLDPGVTTGLNGLLQGGQIMIPETGEVIRPAEGFRFFAANNPNDIAAGYFGRNTQDAANEERFWTLPMSYPLPEEEIPLVVRILTKAGTIDTEVATLYAEKMVDVANRVRKLYCGESDQRDAIDITMSTRSLKRWAALFCMFDTADRVLFSLRRAVTNRASKETATAIENTVKAVFGLS